MERKRNIAVVPHMERHIAVLPRRLHAPVPDHALRAFIQYAAMAEPVPHPRARRGGETSRRTRKVGELAEVPECELSKIAGAVRRLWRGAEQEGVQTAKAKSVLTICYVEVVHLVLTSDDGLRVVTSR